MQIEWSQEEVCRSWRVVEVRGGGADAHGQGPKWRLKRSLLWGMKKVSSGDGDTRRRSAAEPRQQFAGCGRVISCAAVTSERWRTKLELSCGESFDDRHRSATLGTAPKRVRFLGAVDVSGSVCGGAASQSCEAQRQ